MRLRSFLSTIAAITMSSSAVIAQPADAGLRTLTIPEGVAIGCDTTMPSPPIAGIANPAARNLELGSIVRIGAERSVSVIYDSTGRPLVLTDMASAARGRTINTQSYAVIFVDDTTAQGLRMDGEYVLAPGATRRGARDSDSSSQHDLMAGEIVKAWRLANWIWKRACR